MRKFANSDKTRRSHLNLRVNYTYYLPNIDNPHLLLARRGVCPRMSRLVAYLCLDHTNPLKDETLSCELATTPTGGGAEQSTRHSFTSPTGGGAEQTHLRFLLTPRIVAECYSKQHIEKKLYSATVIMNPPLGQSEQNSYVASLPGNVPLD